MDEAEDAKIKACTRCKKVFRGIKPFTRHLSLNLEGCNDTSSIRGLGNPPARWTEIKPSLKDQDNTELHILRDLSECSEHIMEINADEPVPPPTDDEKKDEDHLEYHVPPSIIMDDISLTSSDSSKESKESERIRLLLEEALDMCGLKNEVEFLVLEFYSDHLSSLAAGDALINLITTIIRDGLKKEVVGANVVANPTGMLKQAINLPKSMRTIRQRLQDKIESNSEDGTSSDKDKPSVKHAVLPFPSGFQGHKEPAFEPLQIFCGDYETYVKTLPDKFFIEDLADEIDINDTSGILDDYDTGSRMKEIKRQVQMLFPKLDNLVVSGIPLYFDGAQHGSGKRSSNPLSASATFLNRKARSTVDGKVLLTYMSEIKIYDVKYDGAQYNRFSKHLVIDHVLKSLEYLKTTPIPLTFYKRKDTAKIEPKTLNVISVPLHLILDMPEVTTSSYLSCSILLVAAALFSAI